jgi:hypothetical protein
MKTPTGRVANKKSVRFARRQVSRPVKIHVARRSVVDRHTCLSPLLSAKMSEPLKVKNSTSDKGTHAPEGDRQGSLSYGTTAI